MQLHAWGDTLDEAFEQAVIAMFAYMTDLTRVTIDPAYTQHFEVQGRHHARRLRVFNSVRSASPHC